MRKLLALIKQKLKTNSGITLVIIMSANELLIVIINIIIIIKRHFLYAMDHTEFFHGLSHIILIPVS